MIAVALIPSYEPDEKLVTVVSGLHERRVECVVVDDGSSDASQATFASARHHATIIGYEPNRGKGFALKEGLAYIQGHYGADTVVVTVDGDGQHSPDDVVACAKTASKIPGALVLGSRSFHESHVPLKSRLGNLITRGVYRLCTGQGVSDTQTGLRAFSARLIPRLLTIEGERYEYEMNMLLRATDLGFLLVEQPIATIYENNNESSHFKAVQDSARIYGAIMAHTKSSIAKAAQGMAQRIRAAMPARKRYEFQ